MLNLFDPDKLAMDIGQKYGANAPLVTAAFRHFNCEPDAAAFSRKRARSKRRETVERTAADFLQAMDSSSAPKTEAAAVALLAGFWARLFSTLAVAVIRFLWREWHATNSTN